VTEKTDKQKYISCLSALYFRLYIYNPDNYIII